MSDEKIRAVKNVVYVLPFHDALRRTVNAQDLMDFLVALQGEDVTLADVMVDMRDGSIHLSHQEFVF